MLKYFIPLTHIFLNKHSRVDLKCVKTEQTFKEQKNGQKNIVSFCI
jgi:hypothetical protein